MCDACGSCGARRWQAALSATVRLPPPSCGARRDRAAVLAAILRHSQPLCGHRRHRAALAVIERSSRRQYAVLAAVMPSSCCGRHFHRPRNPATLYPILMQPSPSSIDPPPRHRCWPSCTITTMTRILRREKINKTENLFLFRGNNR
jgi:hypothetical protein